MVGLQEWLIPLGILLVILIFGGRKFGEIGKGLGEGIRNFKKSVDAGRLACLQQWPRAGRSIGQCAGRGKWSDAPASGPTTEMRMLPAVVISRSTS